MNTGNSYCSCQQHHHFYFTSFVYLGNICLKMFSFDCCICSVLPFAFIIAFLVWFLLRADGDLTVLFAEKFGKPVADLKDQVVWITGASSGIGEALAHELATVGAKLILSGTNRERLENVKKECLVYGPIREEDILVLQFDISQFSVHEENYQKVLDRFGKIDILINNAGRSQRSSFGEVELAVDREMFDVNVFGPVNLSRIVLRHFKERGGGQFVVTSSAAGVLGVPFSPTYTASKHALHGYFECLRSESCREGIDITIACPGPVTSRILENAFTGTQGKIHGGQHNPEDKRMTSSRCAHLMAVAMVNKLDHVWVSIQPVLLTYYLAQYTPTFFRCFVIKRILTDKLVKKMRDGNAPLSAPSQPPTD